VFKLPHPGSLTVDPLTGSLDYVVEDLRIPCRGRTEIKVARYYSSSQDHPYNQNIGRCAFSFDERLRFEYAGFGRRPPDKPDWAEVIMNPKAVAGSSDLVSVTLVYPDGSQHRFLRQQDGSFVAFNPAVKRTLAHNPADDTYTLGIPGFGFHQFRSDGKMIAQEDAFGNRIRFDWDYMGLGPAGRVFPQITAITDPIGRVVRFDYTVFPPEHELNFIRTMTDWTGRTWRYEANSSAFVVAFVDPEGNITRYHQGGRDTGFPVNVEVPTSVGVDAPTLQDGLHDLHRIEFPNGVFVTNYAWGGRPSGKRVGVQVFGDRVAVNHLYDVLGRRTTRLVGTAENAWFYEYDENYNLIRTRDPLGNEQTYEYDERQRLVTTVDPRLGITRRVYDSQDRLVRLTDPAGRTTSFEHHPTLPEVTAVTGPGPDRPRSTYEYHYLSGALLRQVDPLGNRQDFEYSVHGELLEAIGPGQARTAYRYSEAGYLVERISASGASTRFEHDELGRVVQLTSPAGRVTRFAYNRLDLVTRLTKPDGGTWEFEYDGNRNLVKTTDPLGNCVRYEYSSLNELLRVVDPAGSVTTMEYGPQGDLVRVLDALGRSTDFHHDLLSRLVEVVDPEGQSTRIERERSCGQTRTVDPLGRETVEHRDLLCRVSEVELPDGGRVQTTYNPAGRLESVTDPLGRTTRFEYDLAGRLTAAVDPLGQTERRSYDQRGNLVSLTDRRGHTATFEYDADSRLCRMVRRDGSTLSFEYDPDDLLTALTDGRGATRRFRYDEAGRLTATTSPEGVDTVSNTWDPAGRLVEQLSALGRRTTFEYDENHRVVTVTDPLGNRSTRDYDRAGNLLRLVDPKGRATRMEYDRLDRLVKVTDPLGGVVHRLLDAVGNLVGVADQKGNQTSYEYDAANRVKAEVYADGSRLEWDWDLAGNLLVQRDPRGFVTGFEHDALDRLVRLTYTDEPEATFAYDANSNLVERRDGTGTYTFEHDPEDRVSAFTQPTGSRYRVQHDGEGNRTAFFFPDGSCQALTYDPSGRLSQMRTPDGRHTTFHYDAEGLRTRIDRPNGTRTLYEYDLATRLTRVAHLAADGSKVTPDFRLTRDALGNVLNVKDEDSPLWTYGYDDLDRLVQAVDHVRGTTSQWAYDAVGNRLSETVDGTTTLSRYNALNQLVQMGATRFWYDRAGNLTRQAGPGSVTGYRFDSRDRLVQVHTPSNQHVHYTYDAVGRMQTRRLGTQTRPTRLEWDGWDLAREVAPNGLETTYHVPEGEILGFKRRSQTHQVHSDALGSVRVVTNSSGMVVLEAVYDGWGEDIAQSGSVQHRLGYIGAFGVLTDTAANLKYVRYRWYDPLVARFLSRDPLGPPSRYSYADGNPVTNSDPSGLDVAIIVGGRREGSYNVFGHVAIAIEGHGVFSFGTSTPPGQNLGDYLGTQTPFRNQVVFIAQTSKQQDTAAVAYLRRMRDDLNTLAGDTCATRSGNVLGDIYGFEPLPEYGGYRIPNYLPDETAQRVREHMKIFGVEEIQIPRGFQGPFPWQVKFSPPAAAPAGMRR